ncbi:hypothetical protein R1sor_022836 [Riccia sorocarpa]|uniref:Uncharacterized protein n=1 Tax=Riccia sorocarpa TaxID=122646 RepID=A0ABD3GP64_9MARC
MRLTERRLFAYDATVGAIPGGGIKRNCGSLMRTRRRCIAKRARRSTLSEKDDDFVRTEACEDLTLGGVLTVRWPTRDTEPPPYRPRRRGTVLPWEFGSMARTKQTARRHPGGRPPSPSRGQAPVRREAKKIRSMSDPETSHQDDVEDQQNDQASDASESEAEGANQVGGNEEEEEEEEESIGTLDLLRMVKANEIRQHKGPCLKAKSLGFWFKDNEHWTDKRCLMELFWDVKQEMVDDHISTSQIVRVGLAVTDVKCSLTAKDVYFRLNRLEERLKIEKTKRKADGAGPSNPKKSRTADVDVVEVAAPQHDTFDQFTFEKFVKKWELGKIPDVHGNTSLVPNDKGVEQHRDFSQLSVNRFRPVNGLNDEDLRLVWNQLETGNVWVAKPAKYQGTDAVVSLRDFCKALKAKRSLALRIVKYWQTRYREVYDNWDELAAEYPFPPNWLDGMIKWVPDKAEKEMPADEASSSDLEDEDGVRRRRRTKKKSYFVEPLPSQVVTAVHRLYQAKRGEATPERLEPIHVLHVKDISKYQLTLDEKLDCQLVLLDLTHPHMVTWEKQEFSSFLSIVRDLTVAKHFTVVAVMEFGQTPVDFTNALKEMKDARVSFEYGCYEGPRVHRRSAMSYPCWQLMYVFVSLDAEEYNCKPVLVDDRSKRPFLIEYEPDSWLHETEQAEGDDADNIKFRIPCWSFVDMTFPDEFATHVHPVSKRSGFCNKMIINFSTEGSSVFDFFSGGIFAREALLNCRDVVYFASSPIELEFITKYTKALLLHNERVKQWFTRYSSSKGHGSSRQILAGAEEEQRAHAAGAHMRVVVVDEALMGDALARLGTALPRVVEYDPYA